MTPHHEAMVARHREVRARLFPSKPSVVPAWRVARAFVPKREQFIVRGRHKNHDRSHYPQPIGPLLYQAHPSHDRSHYPQPIGPLMKYGLDTSVYHYNLQRLVCAVADFYGVSITEIKSKRKTGCIARARHVIFFLSRETTPLSYPEIGQAFDGRDHTTIIYGFNAVRDRIGEDKALASEVEEIRARLTSLYLQDAP